MIASGRRDHHRANSQCQSKPFVWAKRAQLSGCFVQANDQPLPVCARFVGRKPDLVDLRLRGASALEPAVAAPTPAKSRPRDDLRNHLTSFQEGAHPTSKQSSRNGLGSVVSGSS